MDIIFNFHKLLFWIWITTINSRHHTDNNRISSTDTKILPTLFKVLCTRVETKVSLFSKPQDSTCLREDLATTLSSWLKVSPFNASFEWSETIISKIMTFKFLGIASDSKIPTIGLTAKLMSQMFLMENSRTLKSTKSHSHHTLGLPLKELTFLFSIMEPRALGRPIRWKERMMKRGLSLSSHSKFSSFWSKKETRIQLLTSKSG